MTKMSNQDQLRQERKIKQARYLLEDFQDATKKFGTVGIVTILLGGILLLSSLIFGANSIPQGMLSIIIGGAIFVLSPKIEWFRTMNLYSAVGIYLAIVLAEFFILGLPDRIIPGLGETARRKAVNVITLANDITPWLYIGIKATLVYPTLMALNYRNKMESISSVIKQKVGIKEL
jgi:hypothetical protein